MADTHQSNKCPLIQVRTVEDLKETDNCICCSTEHIDMDHSSHGNLFIICPDPSILEKYSTSLRHFMESCDTDKTYTMVGFVKDGSYILFNNCSKPGPTLEYIIGNPDCEGFHLVPSKVDESTKIFNYDNQDGCLIFIQDICHGSDYDYDDPFDFNKEVGCCGDMEEDVQCQIMDYEQKQSDVQKTQTLLQSFDADSATFDDIVAVVESMLNCIEEDHPKYDLIRKLIDLTEEEFVELNSRNDELLVTIIGCCDMFEEQNKEYKEKIRELKLKIGDKNLSISELRDNIRDIRSRKATIRDKLNLKIVKVKELRGIIRDKMEAISEYKSQIEEADDEDEEKTLLIAGLEEDIVNVNLELDDHIETGKELQLELNAANFKIANLEEVLEEQTDRANRAQEFRQIQTARADRAQAEVRFVNERSDTRLTQMERERMALLAENDKLRKKLDRVEEEEENKYYNTEKGQIIISIIIIVVITAILMVMTNSNVARFVLFFFMLGAIGIAVYKIRDKFDESAQLEDNMS